MLDSPPSLELNDEDAVIATLASRFELVAAKNPYLLNRLALSLSSKSVRDAGESRRVRAPAREQRDSEAPAASLGSQADLIVPSPIGLTSSSLRLQRKSAARPTSPARPASLAA